MSTGLRYIAHLDLDCFFVSVERIHEPRLIGKPVIVGGSATGRGVVASASYEARKFGVRSAMPTAQALRLCPNLIVVRGRHGEYGKISDALYRRMCELAPIVERASIDEMNLDLTGCESMYAGDLPGFIKTLQKLVADEFKLPSTIGLASNKTLAKIAANTVKPNGVIHVPHGTEKSFLAPLSIAVIPGIGKKTEEFLLKRGFKYVSDLQTIPREEVVEILGKHGLWIHAAANGGGSDTIHPEQTRKSISREETFGQDISNLLALEKILHELTEDVCSTLRKKSWKARTITLKLRYADFRTITRAVSLEPTQDDAVVFRASRDLLHQSYTRKMSIRLIGVGLTNFVDDAQTELPLFTQDQQRDKMLDAVNKIRNKFGDDSIHVGSA